RYPGGASPPIVVAKATGALVESMRALAERHGVPVVERPSLAQALLQETSLNQPIDSRQYAAVAQVFSQLPERQLT
ncbi:MAG: EscU/YscU/HrcU family type III secretion system export apparatus switch protein, partial [Pirellulales bacterium]